MAKTVNETCEELINAWLTVSKDIRKDKPLSNISFNEYKVLGLLYNNAYGKKSAKDPVTKLTATDILEETGMLKSQVNRVLTGLAGRQYISIKASKDDKRKKELSITKRGTTAYEKEHKKVLELTGILYKNLGNKRITDLTKTLQDASQVLKTIPAKKTTKKK